MIWEEASHQHKEWFGLYYTVVFEPWKNCFDGSYCSYCIWLSMSVKLCTSEVNFIDVQKPCKNNFSFPSLSFDLQYGRNEG